jgi:hypothetical protein
MKDREDREGDGRREADQKAIDDAEARGSVAED